MKNVYIIREFRGDMGGAIKIGIAKDVKSRLDSLQTGNPRELRVISQAGPFSSATAHRIEATMHNRFGNWRIQGEWFSARCLERAQAMLILTLETNGKVVPTGRAVKRYLEQQVDMVAARHDELMLSDEIMGRI